MLHRQLLQEACRIILNISNSLRYYSQDPVIMLPRLALTVNMDTQMEWLLRNRVLSRSRRQWALRYLLNCCPYQVNLECCPLRNRVLTTFSPAIPAGGPPPHGFVAGPGQGFPPQTFDTTGQIAPAGMKPRVTATLWEDEGSLCFQVEAKGVCVARREGIFYSFFFFFGIFLRKLHLPRRSSYLSGD